MNGLTEQQVQALVVRALKTFVQALLAVIVAQLTNVTSLNTGKGVVIAAIAAGVSAVINLFIKPVEAK